MPLVPRIRCPECGQRLIRKPAGICPRCGCDVRGHARRARLREERIEKVTAVVSTALVVTLFVVVGGFRWAEAIAAYAVAGAAVWWFARRTFS